jgi:predicted negative regulator of RcsB-dependent stress response
MPIFDDPSAPQGKSIPLQKPDIDRLRSAGDEHAFAKAYQLDPGFRRAADHYFSPIVSAQLDSFTKKKLPSSLLNRYYYNSWEKEGTDDLTATMAQDASQPPAVDLGSEIAPPEGGYTEGDIRSSGVAGRPLKSMYNFALGLAQTAKGIAKVPFTQQPGGMSTGPLDVLGNVADAGRSIVEGVGQKVAGATEMGLDAAGITTPQPTLEKEALGEAITTFTKKYGSFENIVRTLATNPAEIFNDIAVFTSPKTAPATAEAIATKAPLAADAVRAALPDLKPKLLKMNARWANVSDDVLERAIQNPERMEEALTIVRKNADNPYTSIAQETGGKLMKYDDDARNAFKQAKENFVAANEGGTFDVSQGVGRMAEILKKEHNVGLKVSEVGGKVGLKVELKPGPANKFTSKETDAIQELVNTVANAKNFTADDLLDLEKTFDKAYNSVRLTELKQPKEFHAMVMKLKDGFDDVMRGGKGQQPLLPLELRDAYAQLSSSKKLLREYGTQLLQGEGDLRRFSDNAEGFIKSLSNTNRGVRRSFIKRLDEALGLNLGESVDFLEDAKLLSKVDAPTAGRQGDIVRSVLLPAITGTVGAAVGGVVGGLPGGFAGQAAGTAAGTVIQKSLQSPSKLGDRAIEYGKKLKKTPPKPK